MGCIEHGKASDVSFPPWCLRLFDGPAYSAVDTRRIFGHGLLDGVPVVGTIIKPVLDLQAALVGEMGYGFWQGGDYTSDGQVSLEGGHPEGH
eukprot:838669-Alexandrium_andersonii.AAC.1